MWAGLLVLVWSSIAVAQPDDPDALIEAGVELRTQGRDEEALALFERAHEISPSPRALAQIALAEQALARFVAADRHLREALAAGGDSYIERHRRLLTSSLQAIDRNLVGVQPTGPAGVRVRIRGDDVGTLPLRQPVYVEPGRVTIEAESGSGPPVRMEVETGPAGSIITPAIDVTAPTGPVGEIGGGRGRSEPVDEAGGGGLRVLGFVGAGLAVASLAVGIIGHVGRENAAADFNANPTCGTDDLRGECVDLEASVSSNGTLAIIGYTGAAVLGIVSAILLSTGGSSDTESRAASGCAPTIGGVSCRF